MSLQTPIWLNETFFEKILKRSENDESIEVTHVGTNRATMVGDNFLSDMLRASVEYSRDNAGERETKKISLIIKIAPTTQGCKELIAEFGAFETEIEMMEFSLVDMNKMLNEKDYRLSPNVLYTEKGEPSLLVMEDLTPLGYVMADRQARLDLEHCLFTMRGLAKFHASSVALLEKHPKILNTYSRGIFHIDNPEGFQKAFQDGFRTLGYEVLNWLELGSSRHDYSKKLLKFSEVCCKKAAECCKFIDGEFIVLNHGDLWTNNMLFRYNSDGKVTDHIFVDFQTCSWGSPVVDILRFMNTSVTDDVELNHNATLLQEYLKTLTETMNRLSCNTKPPTMALLEKMLKDHEILAVMSTGILPYILMDKNDAMTLEDFVDAKVDHINLGYKGLSYRKIMLRRLPTWDAKGLLDL